MSKRWIKTGKEKILAEAFGKHLTEVSFKNPQTGEIESFVFYDQPDFSVTLAITPEGEVITIWQYYQGVDKVLQVLTGGNAEYPGENPEETAKRELLEEAGYKAEEMIFLGTLPLSVRNSRTRCFLFLALSCTMTEEAKAPFEEEITRIELVPLKEWITRTLTVPLNEGPSTMATYLSLPYLRELDLNEILRESRLKKVSKKASSS